jgi:hypothetical protein
MLCSLAYVRIAGEVVLDHGGVGGCVGVSAGTPVEDARRLARLLIAYGANRSPKTRAG